MKAKGQEAADVLLKGTCKSDSYSSFKVETNTLQWLHWLDILDQQTANLGSGPLSLDSDSDLKGIKQEESLKAESKTGKSSATKDSPDSRAKSGDMFGRSLQTPAGDRFSALKFPEAMVAIAQAAKDLPGWPLMSNKMQMHKCEKCSQEFCSPLNQRRHMRAIHRRPLNGDKEDLKKKREQIAAFWDKLSSEDANEVVAAENLSLMGLSAEALVRALSTQLQHPSLLLLPQSYTKVATALLDLVQSKNTKMSINSGELFAILEEASEKNMLCGVISSSMHRCIFDNDPVRVGLETKNVVASLGFLVEYKLVRAWMDDKDAEALRCQKALVEEEEAAQKRRAKLVERKKQRKLRLKECKDKERRSVDLSSCLQELKLDVFPCEGEHSLTATQSSPSSSASSGLGSHSVETLPISNGEREDAKFATDRLEVCRSFESTDDTEESFSGFSNRLNPQELDTLHSVEERDGRPSTGFSSNGMGWIERRQADGPFFQNHGRQLYGKDQKSYDQLYRGHRLTRASYGVPMYDYFIPRGGHYREKVTTLKRQNAVLGIGHTVWARKIPQTSETLSLHNENENIHASDGRDDFIGVRPMRQSEQLEDNDEIHSAKSEKGLSRVSSLCSDSATSQSSVSVSAKVGAEEQESPENKAIPGTSPHEIFSPKGDNGGSAAALVIGSVRIPLEHPLPAGSRIDYSLENNFAFGLKIDGKNSLPDHPSCSVAYERVEGQVSCGDDLLNPSSGVSCQSGSREDSSVIIKNSGSSLQNKSVVKVWRAVTPGEHSGSRFGAPFITEDEKLNASDTVSEQRKETEVSGRYHSHPRDSLSGSDGPARQGPIGVGEDALQRPDPSATAYFAELRNFLSQRWLKAMSSPDIFCHNELDDADIDETG